MTEPEVYEKAIKRAVLNGYRVVGRPEPNDTISFLLQQNPYSLIFTHTFAKAFWGEHTRMNEEYQVDHTGDPEKDWITINMPAWQANLRKMVLEENAVMYLAQFLVEVPNEYLN